MKIKRFVAKDMRTALTQIKEELGADAVIMSNKKIPEGVELMAAVDYSQDSGQVKLSNTEPKHEGTNRTVSNDVVSIGLQQVEKQAEPNLNSQKNVSNYTQTTQSNSLPADSLNALLNRQVQQPVEPQEEMGNGSIEQQLKNFTERLQQSANGSNNELVSTESNYSEQVYTESKPTGHSLDDSITADVTLNDGIQKEGGSTTDLSVMQKEMASIRSLLEHQVSGLMWQDMAQKDPQRAILVNRLIVLGLNEQIADQIAGYVPQKLHEHEAWLQAMQLVSQQINTTKNDIINRGGVVALVGPTGVGKTTTIAKLAAGFSQVHGADQVALISTDTFRIAGFEQLATYGKIIGCQVSLAKNNQELDDLLQQFSSKKLILIDTAGMGQRDLRLAEQLAVLVTNSRVKIRNYLVLAANSQQRVMQENVERFKKIPLSGCIYTKLDESVSIGEIITTSIQNGLPIGYLTDGQRVPEDIKVANAEKLVTLADKMASRLASNHSGSNVNSMRTMPMASAAAI